MGRISRLFLLVLIAFTWAYLVGLYVHNNIKPIKTIRHGYRAKNFVKLRLETIISILVNGYSARYKFNIFEFVSCSLGVRCKNRF